MNSEPEGRPLLPGRGVVLIDDFCRHTGLDQATVERLMKTELAAAALWRDEEQTRPFGILDDMLPTREAMVALAIPVREDYDPGNLTGFDLDDHGHDPEPE